MLGAVWPPAVDPWGSGAAGARFLGMEEVRGSIPLCSTRIGLRQVASEVRLLPLVFLSGLGVGLRPHPSSVPDSRTRGPEASWLSGTSPRRSSASGRHAG